MKKTFSVILCVIIMCAAVVLGYAAGTIYTLDQTVPGLENIRPCETLNFPSSTIWAKLTAVWGVNVTFLDYGDIELASDNLPEGTLLGDNAAIPTPSAKENFYGWECDKDVEVDGETKEAGTLLSNSDVAKVVLKEKLVFKAKYKGFDGSIIVENATKGKDYDAIKLFDLTYSGDAVSYTYTSSDEENDELLEALLDENSPFELTRTGDGEYNVEIKDGKTIEEIIEWADENLDLLPDPVTETITATETVIKFEDIPYGYYFVTSTLGSIVTIDSTLKNVQVVDKNQDPVWGNNGDGKVIVIDENTVDVKNTASFGDEVVFDIEIKSSNYLNEELVTYYYITDTVNHGFDYVFDNNGFAATVTVGDKVLTPCEIIDELTEDNYYIYLDGRTFTIIIKWAHLVDGRLTPVYFDDQFNDINVVYSATVNSYANIGQSGNPNVANFTCDTTTDYDPEDHPTDEEDPDEDPDFDSNNEKKTDTYVYAVAVKKLDENNDPLTGAKFSIADVKVAATATAGVYAVDETNGTAGLAMDCDDNGYLVVEGLAEGDYTLKEVKAPDGYNKAANDVELEVVAYADDKDYTTFKVPVADYASVVNQKGSELPATGGIGTMLFIGGGALLIMIAAILLLTNKRIRGVDVDEASDPDDII